MKNLILVLLKYGALITFIVFEIICFRIVVSQNKHQKEIYLHSSNLFTGRINEKINEWTTFSKLRQANDSLRKENAWLLEQIINIPDVELTPRPLTIEIDSQSKQYYLIPAEVCNKSERLRNKFFTLCKGEADGVEKGMGVISKNGVIGKVSKVSKSYAVVTTILNTQSGLSVAVKGKKAFGILEWQSTDPRKMALRGIPKHLKLTVGDTIITSGYSTIFPKGIEVGKIEAFDINAGDNNYRVEISLNNDLLQETDVFVINNILTEEQTRLEKEVIQ